MLLYCIVRKEIKSSKLIFPVQEKAKALTDNIDLLNNEFFRLGEYVKENVVKEVTVAKMEENKPHNRYVDIGRVAV